MQSPRENPDRLERIRTSLECILPEAPSFPARRLRLSPSALRGARRRQLSRRADLCRLAPALVAWRRAAALESRVQACRRACVKSAFGSWVAHARARASGASLTRLASEAATRNAKSRGLKMCLQLLRRKRVALVPAANALEAWQRFRSARRAVLAWQRRALRDAMRKLCSATKAKPAGGRLVTADSTLWREGNDCKIYIHVPLYQKKIAIGLGAQFDVARRRWYVTQDIVVALHTTEPLKSWLPVEVLPMAIVMADQPASVAATAPPREGRVHACHRVLVKSAFASWVAQARVCAAGESQTRLASEAATRSAKSRGMKMCLQLLRRKRALLDAMRKLRSSTKANPAAGRLVTADSTLRVGLRGWFAAHADAIRCDSLLSGARADLRLRVRAAAALRRWKHMVDVAPVQITVEPFRGRSMRIEVPRATTISEVLAILEKRGQPPAGACTLRSNCRTLLPSCKLATIGVKRDDVLRVQLKQAVQGGMQGDAGAPIVLEEEEPPPMPPPQPPHTGQHMHQQQEEEEDDDDNDDDDDDADDGADAAGPSSSGTIAGTATQTEPRPESQEALEAFTKFNLEWDTASMSWRPLPVAQRTFNPSYYSKPGATRHRAEPVGRRKKNAQKWYATFVHEGREECDLRELEEFDLPMDSRTVWNLYQEAAPIESLRKGIGVALPPAFRCHQGLGKGRAGRKRGGGATDMAKTVKVARPTQLPTKVGKAPSEEKLEALDPTESPQAIIKFLADRTLKTRQAAFNKLNTLDANSLGSHVVALSKVAKRKSVFSGKPVATHALRLLAKLNPNDLVDQVDLLISKLDFDDADVRGAARNALQVLRDSPRHASAIGEADQRAMDKYDRESPTMPDGMQVPPGGTAFDVIVEKVDRDGEEMWQFTSTPFQGMSQDLHEFSDRAASKPQDDSRAFRDDFVASFARENPGKTLQLHQVVASDAGSNRLCIVGVIGVVAPAASATAAPRCTSRGNPPRPSHKIYPEQWRVALELSERIRRACGASSWPELQQRFAQVSTSLAIPSLALWPHERASPCATGGLLRAHSKLQNSG